ncbi:uncharacterized protein LOC125236017 isoform X1 [Leguminivora glycinivorella]|uniref:uncharacterized protein LOC125236017 isoform X1 n=1 Tax=Leguminivora glycinivorella TaxID=1035111 RepID=UPI0020109108|nr:uncharacterized protein LOC125236017 isoform X1 [Leguminivora glycinivorella]
MERLRSSVEQNILLTWGHRQTASVQSPIQSDRLWQQPTNMLNSTGGGVQRPVEKWKKSQTHSMQGTVDSEARNTTRLQVLTLMMMHNYLENQRNPSRSLGRLRLQIVRCPVRLDPYLTLTHGVQYREL